MEALSGPAGAQQNERELPKKSRGSELRIRPRALLWKTVYK
jgi:hypothetical protein